MQIFRQYHIMTDKYLLYLIFYFILVYPIIFPGLSAAEEPVEILTLEQTIKKALNANIGLEISKKETEAADAAKKAQRTNFYPTFNASYRYIYNDTEQLVPYFGGVMTPQNEYDFFASFEQPIFTGKALLNQYRISALKLDVAKINEELKRQEIIFMAKEDYFSLLKARKLLDVYQDTVKQITAQKEVAQDFYQVGIIPLNDLLQSQVELANAKQDLVVAQNDVEIAKSNLNILLRRPTNKPVNVKDILSYSSFEKGFEDCLGLALKNRLELQVADLDIEIAKKNLIISKKDYYPAINLKGTYYRLGTDWHVNGGEGINDPDGWNVQIVASWDFWEWGRTYYGVIEKQNELSQKKLKKNEIYDNIRSEVKKSYLKTKESEKNIKTMEKAIEQAKENLRINKNKYKERVATSTDVLVAQTLLTKTMTNYYNALYNFKISKASLFKAMGIMMDI